MPGKSTDGEERPAKTGERVAKVIARAGFGSRRDAEEMIAAGRVAVNGTTITTPALNVSGSDSVTVDGKPLPARERTRLFLYHKPRGLVTSHHDPQGRPTVFAALPRHLPRLLSVGRLDYNTEGLLLLTNDGGLARVLELPETGWLRRYRVRAHGRVTQPQLDRLRGGVTIEGIRYGPIEAALDREQGSNAWLTIGIREGKNREVRNVLEHLGLQVTRLIRISFGPFQLGELGEAEVEEVNTRVLRDQLGERIAAEASVDFAGPIAEREFEAPPPRREPGRKAAAPGRAGAQRPPRDDDPRQARRPQDRERTDRRGERGRENDRGRGAERRRDGWPDRRGEKPKRERPPHSREQGQRERRPFGAGERSERPRPPKDRTRSSQRREAEPGRSGAPYQPRDRDQRRQARRSEPEREQRQPRRHDRPRPERRGERGRENGEQRPRRNSWPDWRGEKPAGEGPPRGRRQERREGRPVSSERSDTPRPPPKHRRSSSHVWRQHEDAGERPVRKGKFRGGGQGQRSADPSPAPREKRAGLIADRKGRRVLVERVVAEQPDRPPPRGPKRPGRAPRPDRAAGPRPSRPSRPPRPRGRER